MPDLSRTHAHAYTNGSRRALTGLFEGKNSPSIAQSGVSGERFFSQVQVDRIDMGTD